MTTAQAINKAIQVFNKASKGGVRTVALMEGTGPIRDDKGRETWKQIVIRGRSEKQNASTSGKSSSRRQSSSRRSWRRSWLRSKPRNGKKTAALTYPIRRRGSIKDAGMTRFPR